MNTHRPTQSPQNPCGPNEPEQKSPEQNQDPDNAPSDGPNMVPLHQFEALMEALMAFDRLAKANPISIEKASKLP